MKQYRVFYATSLLSYVFTIFIFKFNINTHVKASLNSNEIMNLILIIRKQYLSP